MKILLALFISMSFIFSINYVSAEKDLSSGTYLIDYEVLHAETDSASIANDYFEKPATLIVEDGEQYIQFSINHSKWMKNLQAPLGEEFIDVTTVSEDESNDIRRIQFNLETDLEDKLEMKMHVLIKEMNPVYDHKYSVRLDFDKSSLEETESVEIYQISEKGKIEEATDDKSLSTLLTITIAVVIIGLFVFLFFYSKRRRK